jgi:rhodanese-related sulfurtransferase
MPITQIIPNEAFEILEKDPDAIYVDVRSVPEFVAEHPIRAINLPLLHKTPYGMDPNPDFQRVATTVLPKNNKLVVGCFAGGRSQKACEILEQSGYELLYNVCGGFGGGRHLETDEPVAGWKESGLPTSTDNSEGVSWESLKGKG